MLLPENLFMKLKEKFGFLLFGIWVLYLVFWIGINVDMYIEYGEWDSIAFLSAPLVVAIPTLFPALFVFKDKLSKKH